MKILLASIFTWALAQSVGECLQPYPKAFLSGIFIPAKLHKVYKLLKIWLVLKVCITSSILIFYAIKLHLSCNIGDEYENIYYP
jgi:hypothetical protein